jgi:vitamin B12 transporter
LELTLSAASVQEIVNVSADVSQPIDEVAKTVSVISGQEMRDRADITLIDSLRTIPGFRIQQLGGFGRTANIKSRGLRNQDTAVLIDGIRVRDAAAITGDATPFLGDITLTSVSRVEALRGSGSSLYGTNAIGGVIDLRTPEPAAGWHGQLSGAFGGLGLGRFRGNISNRFLADRVGFNAAVARTVYAKGIDGNDDADNTNVQGRIDANPSDTLYLSGRLYLSDAFVRLNTGPDTIGALPPAGTVIEARAGSNFSPDVDDPDDTQRSRIANVQLVAAYAVNGDLSVKGYYSDIASRRRNESGPLGVGFQSSGTSIFKGTIRTANTTVEWMPHRTQNIKAGYEYEYEEFRNDGISPTTNFFTIARQSSSTFFVQDLMRLFSGRLQIAGGFRAQFFDPGKPEFSSASSPFATREYNDPEPAYTVDAAVAYTFRSTGTKLRAHAGNGYRVPSLYERFGSYFFFNDFFPLGNPGLEPERSIGYDGGIEQTFASGRVRLSGTYFYTEISDEITYLPTDDLGAPSYYNFDKHFSRGVELSGTVKPDYETEISASYTFTNSDIRNFSRGTIMPPFNIFSRDRSSFGIPDHQFALNATRRWGRFWINADLLATSSYLAPIFSNTSFATHVFRFEGNRRMDATAGYTFKLTDDRYNLRLFGTVENVFDQAYYENGFRTPGRNGRLGLSFAF